MAIIRNDRRAREVAEARREEEPEEEVDYSWHPSDEEFPDPIPTDRWLVMLDDPTVFDEDGLHAVECVDDYGGPVTFQQLSVKYRGTMGRYRRWLNGVAERAAQHEGREPLLVDDSGAPQWWPYLYRQRTAGKAVANVFEMVLRPELTEALRQRSANSAARRKEEARAQAEAEARRRSEQRRARLEAAARAQAERDAQEASVVVKPAPSARANVLTPPETEEGPAHPEGGRAHPAPQGPSQGAAAGSVPAPTSTPASRPASLAPTSGRFGALAHYLETMASLAPKAAEASALQRKGRPKASQGHQGERKRLDYAKTYAERLNEVMELIGEGLPGLTAARVARELGDESVERLQGFLNGESIPRFAYLDHLCDVLSVNGRRLEATGDDARGLPVFQTFRERYGTDVASLGERLPEEVVFVTDDGPTRRCGAILRFSELRYVLLDRHPVSADADRYQDPGLSSYIRMVREVDELARTTSLVTRSIRLSADEWDALAAGGMWPGTPLLGG